MSRPRVRVLTALLLALALGSSFAVPILAAPADAAPTVHPVADWLKLWWGIVFGESEPAASAEQGHSQEPFLPDDGAQVTESDTESNGGEEGDAFPNQDPDG